MLEQKVESTTAQLIKINPKNTTKTCSNCGELHNMPLYKREMNCKCGLSIDRDTNSAINILMKGGIKGMDFPYPKPSHLQKNLCRRTNKFQNDIKGNKKMIVRRKGRYIVKSEKTGRKFGIYRTLAEAKRRLQQIEFFKRFKIEK